MSKPPLTPHPAIAAETHLTVIYESPCHLSPRFNSESWFILFIFHHAQESLSRAEDQSHLIFPSPSFSAISGGCSGWDRARRLTILSSKWMYPRASRGPVRVEEEMRLRELHAPKILHMRLQSWGPQPVSYTYVGLWEVSITSPFILPKIIRISGQLRKKKKNSLTYVTLKYLSARKIRSNFVLFYFKSTLANKIKLNTGRMLSER